MSTPVDSRPSQSSFRDRILSRLSSLSLSPNAPIAETASAIVELSAEDINARRAAGELGNLVSLVKNWQTGCKQQRFAEEVQWRKNIDMYQGRQFTEWNPQQSKMIEIRRAQNQVRISVNVVEPICRTQMAKLSGSRPMPTVSPASNDLTDILAAQAGEAAIEWWYDDQDYQTKVLTPALLWSTLCGMGFIKDYWDPSLVDIAAEDAARINAERQNRTASTAAAGNVTAFPGASFGVAAPSPAAPVPDVKPGRQMAKPVTPFNLFVPDPAVLDIQDQPYVIEAYTMSIEAAKLRYGDRLPTDWNPGGVAADAIVNLNWLGIMGGGRTPDSVVIMECWIKPGYSMRFPKGGLVILAGDEVVHLAETGIPYKHGQFPYSALPGIENGKFYRKAIVESITPLQNELNRTMSQIIQRKNVATAPGFFYRQGSTDPNKISNRPGSYVPIAVGFEWPIPIPITETPQYVLQLIDTTKAFLDDISGQHQVSRAISPGADTAASAIALLQETDNDFLGTMIAGIDTAMKATGRRALSNMVQFWDEPRLVKVVGGSKAFDAKMLMGADLRNGTDLRTESGSDLPLSKTARNATVSEWMQNGWVSAQDGLEVMGGSTLGRSIFQRIKLDRDYANQEMIRIRDDYYANQADYDMQVQTFEQQTMMAEQMAAEMPPQVDPMTGQPMAPQMPAPPSIAPVEWMANHAVCATEHKAWAKGQEYRGYPDALKKIIEWHTAEHEAEIMAEAAMQQAAMMYEQAQAPAGDEMSGAPGAGMPQLAATA